MGPNPFETGTKLVRISIVFTRDLVDPVRIRSAIWYQMSPLKKVPLFAIFWRKTYPQTFSPEFLSISEYKSWKKTACYRPLKNRHFVRVCMEKMVDHQYRENGARNTYSNHNQMRAYVECFSNQPKKLYLIDLSIEQSTKLWGFRNSTGRFCVSVLPEYCSLALTAQA